MIKRLFGIFIPLCIFSFIAFGISAAVLGTGYNTYDTAVSEVYYTDYGVVDGGSDISSWELYESYSDIRLDIGAYNVTLYSGQEGDNTTYFNASRVSGDSTDIRTELSGDTLVVSIDESFNKFINFGFDFLDRLFKAIRTGEGFEDIFGGSRLDIIVPPQVYDSLEVNMGSGSVEIVDINAASNNLYLGSGSMSFSNGNDFTSDSLVVDMGSGYIQAYGVKTKEYAIDVGSGKYEIFGLSGDGSIEMGSGNGTVSFDTFNGDCDVSVGSGTLGIYVPSGASMKIDTDIGSGSVYVNTADHNSRLRDGDSITVGGGEYEMSITLNSGKVTVSESYTELEATTSDLSQIDFGVVPIAGSNGDSFVPIDAITSIVEEQVESAVEIAAENIAYFVEAPKAPEAPSAPQAPALALSGYKRG